MGGGFLALSAAAALAARPSSGAGVAMGAGDGWDYSAVDCQAAAGSRRRHTLDPAISQLTTHWSNLQGNGAPTGGVAVMWAAKVALATGRGGLVSVASECFQKNRDRTRRPVVCCCGCTLMPSLPARALFRALSGQLLPPSRSTGTTASKALRRSGAHAHKAVAVTPFVQLLLVRRQRSLVRTTRPLAFLNPSSSPSLQPSKMALAVRVAKPALSLRGPGVSRRAAAPRVLCSAKKADGQQAEAPRVALPVAALVGAALLTSALVPEEALAAKSSGRVGGSGFSSRRAAAPSAASS